MYLTHIHQILSQTHEIYKADITSFKKMEETDDVWSQDMETVINSKQNADIYRYSQSK